MRRTIILFSLALLLILPVSAQIAESGFSMSWSVIKPTYTEFVKSTSTRGMRIGYTKFFNERFGAGFDAGYSAIDDYVPRTTYESPGGAFTTDIYNYMYYYTGALVGQYYFKTSGLLIPYASLAAGATITEYRIYYNIYTDTDNRAGFLIRPEAGAYFRFKPYSTFGLKGSIGYEYATNKSDYFELKNFSNLNFQLGIMFFND
jgi:hypothetical protein